MTTIQIRIDSKDKEKLKKIFKQAGLNLSSGMRLYLYYVAKTGKVPFAFDERGHSLKK